MQLRTMTRLYLLIFMFIFTSISALTQQGTPDPAPPAATIGPVVDVHVHLLAATPREYQEAAKEAVAVMDRFGIQKMIVMPPPKDGVIIPDTDYEALLPAIQNYPARFAFLGGGGRLNAMIQQTPWQTPIGEDVRRKFEQEAEEVLRQGAIGFGEIAIHHLSNGPGHPYESVPGDHPLLLLLADIAARHDVPLDVHCDVVTADMLAPAFLTSPLDPTSFRANIDGFERLLAHNPKTRVIWEHCGSDTLGCWTAGLSRRLLEKYPNLYLGLRIGPGPGHYPRNYPLMRDGQMKPEWRKLFQDYPARFMIGSDMFIGPPGFHSPLSIAQAAKQPALTNVGVSTFLGALPAELARKFASENAMTLYKLAAPAGDGAPR